MTDDQEKTEQPTSKKLEDARKEGNVAKSQDVVGVVTLVVGFVVLLFYFVFMVDKLKKFYIFAFSFFDKDWSVSGVVNLFFEFILQFFLLIAPVMFAVMLAGIIGNVAQFGFLFTPKSIQPKFSKIDPIKGLKNLFSTKKLFEGVKIILKVSISFWIAFYLFLGWIKEFPRIELLPLMEQIKWLSHKAILLSFVMIGVFAVFAVIDFAFQKYSYLKSLKMSKQEIKDEMKNTEGNPEIKARIRQIQMKMASQRMMKEIPKADVVITNPTHYAVAIKYTRGEDKAPRVIAKGVDFLAQKIKEIARENDIIVLENKPLARQLYAEVELNEYIPEKLYKAVIEVLVYVYKLNGKTI
jgi:flagellar biosynthetic protein FlhB